MQQLLPLALAILVTAPQAQELPLTLPYWASDSWNKESMRLKVKASTRINPFLWRGDFNADGRPDLAFLVESTVTGKEGILFLLQRRGPVLVGAGVNFGNGGDNFRWMDDWHVEDRGAGHGNYVGASVLLQGDGLVVAKEGAASALIYWKRGKSQWRQYGD
jgi:hypothetical protein